MSNNGNKKNIDLKILLVGDSNVGKTTLLLKYLQGEFIVNLDITWRGVNLFRKLITKNPDNDDSINYFINIWDIAGSENYIDFFALITEPMDAIIIQTNPDSIEYSLKKWTNAIQRFVKNDFNKFLIVINKDDILLNEAFLPNFATEYNLTKYFIIDSKDSEQVNTAFDSIFEVIINNQK